MNFSAIVPPPNIMANRPVKISPKGNLYKIQISHTNHDDNSVKKYEVWTTKEAVQQHFAGTGMSTLTEEPKEYEYKKFARQIYEKEMRSSGGIMQHKGILVTTDNVTHGDPRLWPHTISHPEVKI